MRVDRYELKADEEIYRFRFISEGRHGKIEKLIRFTEDTDHIYNLEFGDKKDVDEIDDLSRSNNGDMRKILATVANAIEVFSEIFFDSWILLKGSTDARTRLYQMHINRFYSEISMEFDVYGLRETFWEKFKPGVSYESFLIRRKNHNLIY